MPKITFILAISLFFISIGFAQAKEEKQLPDISKMSEQEINKLPMKEVIKHFKDETGPLMENWVLLSLGRLAYFQPLQEKAIRDAIKKFQRDIGQPQTGELTMGQFSELTRRATRFSDNPVYLSSFGDKLSIYSFGTDYISVEGTWTIEGENIAHPINHSKITCHKSRATCEINEVDISVPNSKNSNEAYNLYLYTEHFKVISWTDSEVISQHDAICRTTIMTMNILNNEVFQIIRNKTEKDCEILPSLKKPRIARLNPGYKLSHEFWKKRKRATLKYLNSEVQGKFNALIKALEDVKGKDGKK